MTSLQDLRNQRDTLNREIVQREAEAAAIWDDGLSDIKRWVEVYALSHGYKLSYHLRKNVETVTITNGDITVQVDLGYTEPGRDDWGPWFGIRCSTGVEMSYNTTLPPARAMRGFIDGLLNPEES